MTWQRDTEEKPGKRTLVGNSTSFTITDLHEDSLYIISLVVINAVGHSVRSTVMALTMRTGMQIHVCMQLLSNHVILFGWWFITSAFSLLRSFKFDCVSG